MKKQKVSKEELTKEKYVEEMLKKFSLKTIEDCYENIGFGSISPLKVMNKLNEEYKKDNADIVNEIVNKSGTSIKKSNSDLVIVENISNCKVQFSKCCNPIPGDEIVGYITNSNGVSIHTSGCNNISKIVDNSRKISVSWAKSDISSFTTKIIVKANNRNNILTDVISKLNELKVNINGMNTKTTQDKENIMEFTLNITDVNELQKIIKSIKKVDSVFEVKRAK